MKLDKLNEGLRCWDKKEEKLNEHVGKGNNTFHKRAIEKENIYLKKLNLYLCVMKKFEKERKEYRTRLSASVMIAQGLLNGGLPFRGHDKSYESLYRGHFIEFLKLFGQINEAIGKVILSNAPGNNQLTAPSIQQDICNCFTEEVLKKIFEELGDDVFSILVDESRDISKKEQMVVVLKYVNKLAFVNECFIGLVHVKETTALSLKYAIGELFARYNLSLGRVRGHGYGGANNMFDEFNGLKTLILKENSLAYFVHCFAHQLQLIVVALANKYLEICRFFKEVSDLTNVVGASCKRIDCLRESQGERLQEPRNQEMSIVRAGDTHWSSHEKTSEWDDNHKAQAYRLQLYM